MGSGMEVVFVVFTGGEEAAVARKVVLEKPLPVTVMWPGGRSRKRRTRVNSSSILALSN